MGLIKGGWVSITEPSKQQGGHFNAFKKCLKRSPSCSKNCGVQRRMHVAGTDLHLISAHLPAFSSRAGSLRCSLGQSCDKKHANLKQTAKNKRFGETAFHIFSYLKVLGSGGTPKTTRTHTNQFEADLV